VGVAAFVGGDHLAGFGRTALDMLPHAAARGGALVVAAGMMVTLHQLLPIFPPPVQDQAVINCALVVAAGVVVTLHQLLPTFPPPVQK
jgi:hypothetical protein